MDVFSLTEKKFIPQLNSVDNVFIQQLYMLALNSAKNMKMMGILTDNFLSNRGNFVINSNINNNILNICCLSPLTNREKYGNIVEEIAHYRWSKLNLNDDKEYWKERTTLLFLDYILSSCLCYVEVY